jgi:hypothetical protein
MSEEAMCPYCYKKFIPKLTRTGKRKGKPQIFCSQECRISFYKKSNVCPRCGKRICLTSKLCRKCRGIERGKHKRMKEIIEKSKPICLWCRIPLNRQTSFCCFGHRNDFFKVRSRIFYYYDETSKIELEKLHQLGNKYRFSGFSEAPILNDLYFRTSNVRRETYVEIILEGEKTDAEN